MSTSVASVVKFFPTAQNGFTTTLASTIASGAATVPLNSVSGYTNGDTAVFVVDPTSVTLKQTFTGVIDTAGVQVTGVIWTAGTNATHSAGATVVDYATATHISMMTKGILVDHLSSGAHKVATNFDPANTTLETQKWAGVASAVNELTVTNAATGTAIKLQPSGGDTNVNMNLIGKGTGSIQNNGTDALQYTNYIVSGIVITADSVAVNKNYSISSGVVFINGNFLTVAAVSAQTVGASKDRYIDVRDNGDGTAVYVTNEVNNNAASQALTAGDMRVGIVVAGATTIAATTSINQGEQTRVLPIISSVAMSVTDSLGNLIGNRNPVVTNIGYAQIVTDWTGGSATDAQITGLSTTVIIPAGRKYRVTAYGSKISSGGTTTPTIALTIYSGAAPGTLSTLLEEAIWGNATVTANLGSQVAAAVDMPPLSYTVATTLTFNAAYRTSNGTFTLGAASTKPGYIRVDLI